MMSVQVPAPEVDPTSRIVTPTLSDTDISQSSSDCVSKIVLSFEQAKVLQMVQQGQNVFFTGSAGSLFLTGCTWDLYDN